MSHTFKPGDRVWFEGKKYAVCSSGNSVYPLALQGVASNICFTDNGRIYLGSSKPSLKPVKKKNRQELWVNIYENDLVAAHHTKEQAEKMASHGVLEVAIRFVKAKEQG